MPEVTLATETATVEVASDTAPGVTATVGAADVRAFPSIVAPIARPLPTVVPVKLAV